ncbi:hypothetical protein T10_4435 [Trichinella papuae]|uniref:Phorbol-ester/DAG-type domain-containing protein n=1 Tax=Trichinella papuae TaxID=268474 RepID=A0A0V1M6A6_9BILA|nr:hypothetical protein T10_4435 [Trichinella papuae]
MAMAVVASWRLHCEIQGSSGDKISHLTSCLRRNNTMHLLCVQPRTVSRPDPRSHLPSEARSSRGHCLQSSSRWRCAVCRKKCRSQCDQCGRIVHQRCFLVYQKS